MITSLKCVDLEKQYFDEIDENEKNSAITRNEECNHFEVSMKIIYENFKFKKYFLIIECKNCKTPLKKYLTKNKGNISYYCKKCNNPHICIYFCYENTMGMDEESDGSKKDSQVPGKVEIKVFSTPPSQIQDKPETIVCSARKIYSTPENETKSRKGEKKTFYTPESNSIVSNVNNPPVTKKTYKTPEQKEIVIIFKYKDIKNKKISLNELESLESQSKTIKEAFNIKKEEIINIFENSDPIDIKKSPKELKWIPEMKMEIVIDINDN